MIRTVRVQLRLQSLDCQRVLVRGENQGAVSRDSKAFRRYSLLLLRLTRIRKVQ